jgi:tetratricopeptide (TPR) repeat protein
VEIRFVLAGNAATAGEDAEAIRLLEEILDILPIPARVGPRFPAAEVHARLGRSLARVGRAADAADALRRAVAVGRTFAPRAEPRAIAEWLVEFARAAAAAGRRVEARGALQDALRTDPGNPDAADLLRSLEGP